MFDQLSEAEQRDVVGVLEPALAGDADTAIKTYRAQMAKLGETTRENMIEAIRRIAAGATS